MLHIGKRIALQQFPNIQVSRYAAGSLRVFLCRRGDQMKLVPGHVELVSYTPSAARR
jgi:hypothetical protein